MAFKWKSKNGFLQYINGEILNYKTMILKYFKSSNLILLLLITLYGFDLNAQVLQVKEGKSAIVKREPKGNEEPSLRLPEGTKVVKLGEA